MIAWTDIGMVLILCSVLSILSYRMELLTLSGSISAFLVGIVIGFVGSISWLIVLLMFTIAGFIVTRYKIQLKIKKGLQEGRRGERTYRNVLANGLVPATIAVCAWIAGAQHEPVSKIVFLASISVAASDTMASEMGILSPNTRLITNFERVSPGTDGGVSLYGTGWSIMGAIGASVIGWVILFPENLFDLRIIIPILSGIIGCNIDSLVGATLERRKLVDKLGTNIISMAVGAMFALGLQMI